ncbi:MAG: glycosyltransferase [Sphingomonadaceae bacterium]
MKVLFIHQNFPGQFLHLSADLARDPANQVVALSMGTLPAPAGVQLRHYTLLRPTAPETHPMLQNQETHVLRAEACAAAAFKLKQEGFVPDVIVAHPGWGEALFIKDVFPQAKVVMYCEYYYAAEGQDVGFDPEVPPLTFAQRCQLRLKNITNLLSMEIADAAISPTEWQKSTYPVWAQEKITVIHDGIDLERVRFNPAARIDLTASDGRLSQFKPGDEVLTYVSRNLEPVRGFHIFMRTLPEVLRRNPQAHAIVVGGDEIGYGHAAPSGISWRNHMLAEMGADLDLRRVHFVGKLPYSDYLQLLSISRVHTYWTTPFVLSWSLLEAAVSGVPIVASDTAPVAEFAPTFSNVRLTNFFDKDNFSNLICDQLSRPRNYQQEQPFSQTLDVHRCIKKQLELLMRR